MNDYADFENYEDEDHDENYAGRYDGIPGLVWYAEVRKVRGGDLQIGDWIDALDHSGARRIYDLTPVDPASQTRVVFFSFFYLFGDEEDSEVVHTSVTYDVVDPDSQVAPDGSPLCA